MVTLILNQIIALNLSVEKNKRTIISSISLSVFLHITFG